MWSLRPEHYKMVYSIVPSREEQDAIVRFLGYANGRIERAIRAKRKIIALLNEQKQVIIHRAVTQGVDSSAPLKPSGLPWLVEIPKQWEARPLKQLLVRMDYGTSENARGHGKIRVLGMGQIRDGKILIPQSGSLDRVPEGLLVEKNDLLFNRTNSPELVGKVGLFEGNAADEITFASYLVRLRARPEHSPIWLNYLLNSTGFWSYARSQALVSLHQANLNSSRYARMVLPVPPTRQEQETIVDAIRLQAGALELAVSRVKREIELLREYRTRLVADVVTGQVDVRGVSIPDPAEMEAEEAPSTVETEAVEAEPAEQAIA
jgi:type I restriction enzyme S subunit